MEKLKSGWMRQYLPILEWLPQYQGFWLQADIMAGITLASITIPTAMAYAGIAGVPPLIGLYTLPLPLLFYAIFGTSRTMVIAPDSATALISSVIAGNLAVAGSSDYLTVTSLIAFMVGVLFLGFGLGKMGWIANFIPSPVMKGFIQGLVLVTIIGQVPKLLGLEGGSGNFFARLSAIIHQLPDASLITSLVGIGSLGFLLVLKKFFHRIPRQLVTVILAILMVSVFQWSDEDLHLMGQIDATLPQLTFPNLSMRNMLAVTPGALAIVLVGYAESLGAAQAAAEKTGGEIDPNQELVSHGPANLGSALCSGFVVVGSLSKTSIAMASGAKTQVASIVQSILVILSLAFLMPLFHNLPYATLSAIVIDAMLSMANLPYIYRVRRISNTAFITCTWSFLGVLILGVLPGISLGVILSLLLLIHRASHPEAAVLGKLPNDEMYRDILNHPEATTIPGLLIFRFGAAIIFPNSSYFRTQLKHAIKTSPTPPKAILIDAETINSLDLTAAEMLSGLHQELQHQGIVLGWARLRDSVRSMMRRTGLEEQMGDDCFYERISDGVTAFLQSQNAD